MEAVKPKKTFQEYLDLADPFPFITPEVAEETTLSSHQQILKSLGILVLGEKEGTSTIIAFSEKHTKTVEIKDIGRMRLAHLIQWFGESMETRVFSGSDDMPSSYDYSLNQVRNALAAEGGNATVPVGESWGGGIWETNNRLVLVGSHELAIYNGEFSKSNVPKVDGRLMDFGDVGEWYDFDELNELLQQAGDKEWREAVLDELIELFSRWDNWVHDYDPTLCAALSICTWLQSIWDWRPLVFVTGPTNSGKTCLLENVLYHLYGGHDGLALFSQETSEAGLRQSIGQSSRICILDEFESGKNRALILRLARTSGRGGTVLRGTAQQKANQFGLKHILWCGAIETGLVDAADRNRFILLELKRVKKEEGQGSLKLPSRDELAKLGMKALAVAMRLWKPVKARAIELHDMGVKDVDYRLVESFSLPCAMLGVILGMTAEESHGLMTSVLEGRDLLDQGMGDEEQLFNAIMGSIVHLGRGDQATVGQILFDPIGMSSGDTTNVDKLNSCGIRWVPIDGIEHLFIDDEQVQRQLLRGTKYETARIDQVLLRINGAIRSQQRVSGKKPNGVAIPKKEAVKMSGAIAGEDGENEGVF